MSASRPGLNPEASTWAPPGSTRGANSNTTPNANANANANANQAAQGSSQGANPQQVPAQPNGAEPRQGSARGRRQEPNDGGRGGARNRGRGRGRGGRSAPSQRRVVDQQQPSEPSQSPGPSQASQEGQPPARGGFFGAVRRGPGYVGGGGSSTAPPRAFGNQLSEAQQATPRSRPANSNGNASTNSNGNEASRQMSRNARRRAAAKAASRSNGADPSETGSVASSSHSEPKGPPSTAPDLPTRMHEDIDSGNYDCPICLTAISRRSQIWACSMCYHVAHYDCVSAWVKQALNTGLPLERIRCPACNSEQAPNAEAGTETETEATSGRSKGKNSSGFFGRKLCWCGKQKKAGVAPAALPPHSCGRICGRAYADCHHTCSIPCHAGPCPPCLDTGPLMTCFCGKETSIKPCAAGLQRAWSCGKVCDNTLACRTHKCERICHPDDCGSCKVPMPSTCFCGKTEKEMLCKDRDPPQLSANYGQLCNGNATTSKFEGVFCCDTVCGRAFDCGKHFCKKSCHAQNATPMHCPQSPDVITHCLCGKTELSSINNVIRTSCEDEIPACDKVCDKVLDCGHKCPETCHSGACPPCVLVISAPCACGQTSTEVICSDHELRDSLRCKSVCRSLLSCGQHRCNKVCCSGRPKAAARLSKTKRRATPNERLRDQSDIEAEHTCLRPCGRRLKCGQHNCPQVCHKGACHSCVTYILEDMSCPCGQTVVQAPFLCGTKPPSCDADCPRPLPCGHPSIPHRCHDDQQQPCPRCQRLVSKSCLCGKLILNRVACGADNIQCSNICGKTLKCGVHTCRLPCHAEGKCEELTEGAASTTCSQICGRPKATCGHPCANPCHGSENACSEDEPCGSAIEVTCSCQRQTRKVRCNVSALDPTPTYRRPECDDECLRIQRNAQLKDALRISDDYKDEHLVYSTALMEYFMANREFATAQEEKIRTFFVSQPASPSLSGEPSSTVTSFSSGGADKACIFKPMKRHERQFLHLLAESFNLRSESRDEEPHRYVFMTRPRTGSPAVPDMSLAESEDIYLRLRDKAKAEADQREAETALAPSIKEKEAREAESATPAFMRTQDRKRRFNAIFVPAALAATMRANNAENDTILDDNAFQTIVEAWHQQQQSQKRWAPSSGLGSSSSSSATSTALSQPTVEADGSVILKVLVPAAPPAVVEQLVIFLLSYMNAWWGDESNSARNNSDGQFALCAVDAHYNILRLGASSDFNGDGDDQWNVVANTSSSSRRESATATPGTESPGFGPGLGSGSSQQQPPLSTKRVVFKLRQKQKTATMTTGAAEAERKRWLDILAQQANEEEKPDSDDVEANGDEIEGEKQEEVPAVEHTEELRAALEHALLTGEEEHRPEDSVSAV